MAIPEIYTFSLGEDVFREITIYDEDGAVVDLSDAAWEVYVGIFKSPTDVWATASDAVKKSISGGGVTKLDGGTDGRVQLHIEDTDTVSWNPGTFHMWVKVVNPSGYKFDAIKNLNVRFAHSPLKNL